MQSGAEEAHIQDVGIVWVTGIPGAGKSTVCEALQGRGYEAYDADTDGFRYWRRRDTQERVEAPPGPLPPGWHFDHDMPIERSAVEALARRATGTVFLCGVVGNEDEVWDLFSKVICLVIDDDTLRHRLATRDHTYGKDPEIAAQVISWNPHSEPKYRSLGATIVDATQPLEQVVDAVVDAAHVSSTIRRVTAADAAALKSVRLAALRDAPSAFGSSYASEASRPDSYWDERTISAAAGSERVLFLAVDSGEVVGLAGGSRESPGDPAVDLVSMWTAPSVRRRGIGRRLVAAVVEWARETGATTVSLWVTRGNDPAAALYESLGFRATGDYQPLPSDPCKDEVRMQLRLSDGGLSVGATPRNS